jgi:hypothetical protein
VDAGEQPLLADLNGFWQLPGDFRTSPRPYDRDILPLLRAVPVDYSGRIAAGVDPVHREVWFAIPDLADVVAGKTRMVVYSSALGEWVGEYTYENDQYLSRGQDMLSFRELEAYKLNTGYIIDRRR